MKLGNYVNTPAVENIATQMHDPIVEEVIERYTNIKRYMKMYRIKDSKRAFSNKEIIDEINELDKLISKRFGLNYKHTYATNGNYAVFTVNQGVNNAISKDREAIIDSVNDMLSYCNASGECGVLKDKEKVTSSDDDIYTILKELIKTTNAISKQLSSDKIIIDYNKAVVKNFPKDTVIFFTGDFYTLLVEIDMTPRQLTSILFHEIGHSFTHLSYSYRQVKNTSVLLDTFNNELRDKKSMRDVMVLSAKKAYGKDIAGSDIQVYTALTSVLVESFSKYDVYSDIDSEQLADQFSVRFGLGKDLAEGLDMLHSDNSGRFNFIFEVIGTLLITFLYVLTATLNIILSLGVAIIAIFLYSVVSIFGGLITGVNAKSRVYDIRETRFRRIKLDMVRQLRESGLDKKYVKQLLNDITSADAILAKYVDSKPLMGAVGDVMPWNINEFTNTRLQKELEKLSENDLHVSSQKLKMMSETLGE